MRDMLALIDARLEKNPDDYWVYREILYGVFCGRRQIDEIINKTAEITVKYINLEKADKTDRALIADLAKENLSAENMLRVKRLAEKIYQKIPVDIDKVAADMVEQIIENKWGNKETAAELSAYALSEVPERNKNNVFLQLYHKIRGRG